MNRVRGLLKDYELKILTIIPIMYIVNCDRNSRKVFSIFSLGVVHITYYVITEEELY